MNNKIFKVDKDWTLFLDRDGVINAKIESGYVKKWSEFIFLEGSIEALSLLSNLFKTIIIVTNQRGVGKGLMTEDELNYIHEQMINVINKYSGRIDKIYYCTDISMDRKPNIGMALKARHDFPNIDFKKSIMVGDSITDMQFGNKLNMKCILISRKKNEMCQYTTYENLYNFSRSLLSD